MVMVVRRVVVVMVRNLPPRVWSRPLVRRRMTTTALDLIPVVEAAAVVVVVVPSRETMTTTAMADHDPAAPNDGARVSPITSTRACQLWVLKRTKSAVGIMDIVDTIVTTMTVAIDDLPATMTIAIPVRRVVIVMIPDGGMIDVVMGVDMRER